MELELKTLKAAIVALPAKKDPRKILHGVHVQTRGSQLVIEATDGKILYRNTTVPVEMISDLNLVIPRETVESVLKVVEKKQTVVSLMPLPDDKCNVNRWSLGPLPFVGIKGEFPHCNAVIPDESRYFFPEVAYGASLLERLAKIEKTVQPDSRTEAVILRPAGPNFGTSPSKAQIDNETLVVVMPVKLSEYRPNGSIDDQAVETMDRQALELRKWCFAQFFGYAKDEGSWSEETKRLYRNHVDGSAFPEIPLLSTTGA